MGSDIHGGFINKCPTTGLKTPVKTEWGMDRNYTLFAILADVRNGYGFAGTYRHEPLEAISPDKGLPEWLVVEEEDDTPDLYNKWYDSPYASEDDKELGTWLGDHSYTHMNLREIVLWSGWDNHLQQGGVLTKEHYLETIAVGKTPEAWCGDVSGKDVHKVDENIFKALIDFGGTGSEVTHVVCKWQSEETLREMFKWFLDEIDRIGELHGYKDTYLVVGFDS